MEGFIILLILLAVGCFLCGPVALIISIIALNKAKQTYRQPPRKIEKIIRKEEVAWPAVIEKRVEVTEKEKTRPVEVVEAIPIKSGKEPKKVGQELLKAAAERIKKEKKKSCWFGNCYA